MFKLLLLFVYTFHWWLVYVYFQFVCCCLMGVLDPVSFLSHAHAAREVIYFNFFVFSFMQARHTHSLWVRRITLTLIKPCFHHPHLFARPFLFFFFFLRCKLFLIHHNSADTDRLARTVSRMSRGSPRNKLGSRTSATGSKAKLIRTKMQDKVESGRRAHEDRICNTCKPLWFAVGDETRVQPRDINSCCYDDDSTLKWIKQQNFTTIDSSRLKRLLFWLQLWRWTYK